MKKTLNVLLIFSMLAVPIYATQNDSLPDGNTGDLTLENGAILKPEISEQEKKEKKIREAEIQEFIKDPRYLDALKASEEAEKQGLVYTKDMDEQSRPFYVEGDLLPDGNTGDLTLENGAVINEELTPEERAELKRKEEDVQRLIRSKKYKDAIKSSENFENNRASLSIDSQRIPSQPFSAGNLDSYELRTVYQNHRNVPVRRQEKTYYCGVATVKQLDDYFNGSRYTQNQIAGWLGTTSKGTDFTNVKQFLRDYVKSGYQLTSIGDFNKWHGIVVRSIDNNRPAVIDINSNNVGSIEYSSSGHILNVSGYHFGSIPNEVRVTDPHYRYPGTKWYPAHDLYQANNNHFRKEIIF